MQTRVSTAAEILEEKIRTRRARVGIIGLGYVGLPLAMEFAKAGILGHWHRRPESKVAQLNAGESYVQDVPTDTLAPWVEAGNFAPLRTFQSCRDLDTINIAVPTPLRKTKDPGHELHRVGVPGDGQVSSVRASW